MGIYGTLIAGVSSISLRRIEEEQYLKLMPLDKNFDGILDDLVDSLSAYQTWSAALYSRFRNPACLPVAFRTSFTNNAFTVSLTLPLQ